METSERVREVLQTLKPIEIFDFYDGPRFYSCRDLLGQIYLIYWIDEDRDSNTWLYLRISPERYAALKRGDMTIAGVLAHPEENLAYIVHTSEKYFSVDEISPSQIEADWLPESDDRLLLEHKTLPVKNSSALEVACSSNRQVLDIAFEKASNTYEMGCGKLGRLLESIQNTIYALSCDAIVDVKRVPDEIKYQSEVLVTGLFASSFGVRLQTKGVDFFSSDETARAIQQFSELIDLLGNSDMVSLKLRKLNLLARSRFKHLLQVMVESEISVKTDWGSPSGAGLQAQASFYEIAATLQKLTLSDNAITQTVERSGNLVGVDVESDFFAIILEGNEIIKGKLSRQLSNRQFEVPSRIVAKIEESCIVDPLTDREKWSYILLDAQQVNGLR